LIPILRKVSKERLFLIWKEINSVIKSSLLIYYKKNWRITDPMRLNFISCVPTENWKLELVPMPSLVSRLFHLLPFLDRPLGLYSPDCPPLCVCKDVGVCLWVCVCGYVCLGVCLWLWNWLLLRVWSCAIYAQVVSSKQRAKTCQVAIGAEIMFNFSFKAPAMQVMLNNCSDHFFHSTSKRAPRLITF